MAQNKFKRKLTTIFSADVARYSRPTAVVSNAAPLIPVKNSHHPNEFPAHPGDASQRAGTHSEILKQENPRQLFVHPFHNPRAC